MLTADQKKSASALGPAHALALESVCSGLVDDLFSSTDLCTDIDAGHEAMQAILTRAVRTAALKWNLTHDRLNIFPPELRCMCWSYLSTADMLRLGRICRSWRDVSRGTHLLWATLSISWQRTALRDLLSWSADLPLVLVLSDCWLSQLREVNECLRAHADRLKSLRLSITTDHATNTTDDAALFPYPAPELQSFALQMSMNPGGWGISPDIFAGSVPQLRSVTLSNVRLPGACAALHSVRRLKLEKDCGPLDRIYQIAPALEELELVQPSEIGTLPAVPAASQLSKVTFSGRTLSFAVLLASGYVGLPELAVSVPFDPELIRSAASDRSQSFRCALTLVEDSQARVVLHFDDGRSASFATTDAPIGGFCSLIAGAGAFRTLQHLALPAEPIWCDMNAYGKAWYPSIPDEGLTLPVLRTLTFLCRPCRNISLMDSRMTCERLTAPLLARLEFARDPAAESAGDALDPCRVMLLLERSIACDAPRALELHIDTAGGVRLECTHDAGAEDADDGFARLRACVGRIVLW